MAVGTEICGKSLAPTDKSATRLHYRATGWRDTLGIENAGLNTMNKAQHSKTVSTIFQVFIIALMAVFSVLSLVRGAGMIL